MKFYRRNICVYLLFIPLIFLAAANTGADSTASHAYKVPIGELKHLILGWLEQNGLEVTTREAEMGKVDLAFRRKGHPWKIELRPQSALATQVTLSGKKKDAQLLEFEEDFWAYVNSYVGPNGNDIETGNGNEYVPEVVYSRTGTVVCINTRSNGMSSQFSGFVIDKNGTIICTAHDLIKYKTIEVMDQNGKAYPGRVVKLDVTKDLALIYSEIKPRIFIPLCEGRERLQKDEKLYAIGCPMNQLGKISIGSVTDTPVKVRQLYYWKVLLETSPGSSGSPVFDGRGVLVGMVKGRYRGTNTIGFLIPIERIRAFLNES